MSEIIPILIKIAFLFTCFMSLAAFLTWMERKQSALMQDRIGANRADILGFRAIGLFHIIADSLKMFFKEDFVPKRGHKFLHTFAPFISAFCAMAVFAVIPFGNVLKIGKHIYKLQLVDTNVALLLLLAFLSYGIYGVFFAGISSHNKYGLLGGLRGSAQMLSYEIIMGISIVGMIMISGSLSLRDIVVSQNRLLFGFLPAWGIFLQPLAFIIFLTAGMAETKRTPFDLPEGESEIIGYFIEYSSMKFGLFFLTDFIEVVVVSALVTVFFFGGWEIPYLTSHGFLFPWGWKIAISPIIVTILQVIAFWFKVFFFCWLQLAIRWTLPRFRYDQLMGMTWKMLLPLAIFNVLITGLLILIL